MLKVLTLIMVSCGSEPKNNKSGLGDLNSLEQKDYIESEKYATTTEVVPPCDHVESTTKTLQEAQGAIRRFGQLAGGMANIIDSVKPGIYDKYYKYAPIAFNISRDDMSAILDSAQYDGARVYIGLWCCEDETGDNWTTANSLHMFMVPTTNDGKTDVIPNGPNGQFVYDLITPCPAQCSDNQVLLGEYIAGFSNPFTTGQIRSANNVSAVLCQPK